MYMEHDMAASSRCRDCINGMALMARGINAKAAHQRNNISVISNMA